MIPLNNPGMLLSTGSVVQALAMMSNQKTLSVDIFAWQQARTPFEPAPLVVKA